MYLLEILKEQIVAKNYNGGDNMTVHKMKFRKMGFYKSWFDISKKVSFGWILLIGITVLTISYGIKMLCSS